MLPADARAHFAEGCQLPAEVRVLTALGRVCRACGLSTAVGRLPRARGDPVNQVRGLHCFEICGLQDVALDSRVRGKDVWRGKTFVQTAVGRLPRARGDPAHQVPGLHCVENCGPLNAALDSRVRGKDIWRGKTFVQTAVGRLPRARGDPEHQVPGLNCCRFAGFKTLRWIPAFAGKTSGASEPRSFVSVEWFCGSDGASPSRAAC